MKLRTRSQFVKASNSGVEEVDFEFSSMPESLFPHKWTLALGRDAMGSFDYIEPIGVDVGLNDSDLRSTKGLSSS